MVNREKRNNSNREDWLGREGSNLRMAESKSAALPLGYAPRGAPYSLAPAPARLAYRISAAITPGHKRSECSAVW